MPDPIDPNYVIPVIQDGLGDPKHLDHLRWRFQQRDSPEGVNERYWRAGFYKDGYEKGRSATLIFDFHYNVQDLTLTLEAIVFKTRFQKDQVVLRDIEDDQLPTMPQKMRPLGYRPQPDGHFSSRDLLMINGARYLFLEKGELALHAGEWGTFLLIQEDSRTEPDPLAIKLVDHEFRCHGMEFEQAVSQTEFLGWRFRGFACRRPRRIPPSEGVKTATLLNHVRLEYEAALAEVVRNLQNP